MTAEREFVTRYYFTDESYELLRNDGYHFTPDTPFHTDYDPQRLQTLDSLGGEPKYKEIPRDEFLARYMTAKSEPRVI